MANGQDDYDYDLAAFGELNARLQALGVTGAYLGSHGQILNLDLDNVARLVDLAERGSAHD